MVRRPGLLVVSVLVALVVGGCDGGDPEPELSDEVSLSPSATVSASSGEASPSASLDPTEESAREFIRRWIRINNEMQRTLDVEAFRRISDGDCRSCSQFMGRISEIRRNDGFIRTTGSKVVRMKHDGHTQWTVDLRGAPTKYKESASAPAESLPGGPYTYVAFIKRSGGVWKLLEYQTRE